MPARSSAAAVARQAREREAALAAAVAAKRAEAERAAGEWSSLPAELAPVRHPIRLPEAPTSRSTESRTPHASLGQEPSQSLARAQHHDAFATGLQDGEMSGEVLGKTTHAVCASANTLKQEA